MGIITILFGVALLALGLGSLALRRPLLPELRPGEVALATVPFGLITLVVGLAIQVR